MIITTKLLKPRRRRDWYPTEMPFVRAPLRRLLPACPAPARILDVGAGEGPWGRGARELWPAAHIDGVELSGEPPAPWYDGWRNGDFRTMPFYGEPYDLVMGNIPFGIAEACVRRALDLVEEGGHVFYLLRLAFLESQDRAEGLWEEHPARHVQVFAKRPSFTGDGKTDAIAYAMFHWQKGFQGKPELEWITAREIREATLPPTCTDESDLGPLFGWAAAGQQALALT